MSPDPFVVEVLWTRLLFLAITVGSVWFACYAVWHARRCWSLGCRWSRRWNPEPGYSARADSGADSDPVEPQFPAAPVTPLRRTGRGDSAAALTDAEIDAVCGWEEGVAVVLDHYARGAERLTQAMAPPEIDVVIRATLAAERKAERAASDKSQQDKSE